MVTPADAKLCTRTELLARLAPLRLAGAQVICTNGIFDLMHIGHLRYLAAARAMGDVLVVGVNADASTRRLKGPARPIVPQAERAEMLAGLGCVDFVTIFDEDTAEELVRAIQPEVYVKGGDYTMESEDGTASAKLTVKPLPEAAVVRSYGGRVALIPYVPGHSTTELIARIVEGSRLPGTDA
ncbi:MAG: adenylyltransferase/cytidyltransferase family protein [Ktedonobacterales bacterium]|nr:adenylyltransferase/cytidyltransferase family protein [Ktedonobacterales bacterium]